MATGFLALLTALVGVGPAGDVYHIKDRNISIPIRIRPERQADISELILYVSIDQGKVWSQAGRATPDMQTFSYSAASDGQYWFNVVVVNKAGQRDPADINTAPPQLKVQIDSQKPALRLLSADRAGEDVVVTWDAQEQFPKLETLKLEYRPHDAAAGGMAFNVPVNTGLSGQARFKANTIGSMTLVMQMQDQAGNLGTVQRDLPAATIAAAAPATLPTPVASPGTVNPSVPEPVAPTPAMNNTVSAAVMTADAGTSSSLVPVASNRAAAAAAYSPNTLTQTGVPPYRGDLKPPIFTNDGQIGLEYEVERLGLSGVSKIEVWITGDDGKTWLKWREIIRPDAASRQPLSIPLPEQEGVFGFRLAVYSGTQLTAGSPQSGDAPDERVNVDRTRPLVTLYKPESDPSQANALVLQWSVKDTNLAEKPIRLQWAESPTGEWHDITPPAGVTNAGRYAWVPPANVPLKVHLRISAEDLAGNIGEAVSDKPELVDLNKPIGRIKGVIDPKRRAPGPNPPMTVPALQ